MRANGVNGSGSQPSSKGLSLGRVADLCGVTRKTILRWVKDGMLPSFILPSGHHRVVPTDVAAFLMQHGMPVPDGLLDRGKPRVLIADDDPDVRMVVGRILRERFIVEEASNGIEACLRLGQAPPDILVLDIRMPKMDGLEVCREIRKDAQLAQVKILVLSAHIEASMASELDGVAHGIFPKPFNPAELLEACTRLCAPEPKKRKKGRAAKE